MSAQRSWETGEFAEVQRSLVVGQRQIEAGDGNPQVAFPPTRQRRLNLLCGQGGAQFCL